MTYSTTSAHLKSLVKNEEPANSGRVGGLSVAFTVGVALLPSMWVLLRSAYALQDSPFTPFIFAAVYMLLILLCTLMMTGAVLICIAGYKEHIRFMNAKLTPPLRTFWKEIALGVAIGLAIAAVIYLGVTWISTEIEVATVHIKTVDSLTEQIKNLSLKSR